MVLNVENGDLVRIEYSGYADGLLFDTTSVQEAKIAGAFNPQATYGSVLVAVGKKQVIAGLDDAILGTEISKTGRVTLPPEKAFGLRNPELLRLVPLSQFTGQNINPKPGMVLELDGRPAKIQSVSGGRVRVDFNSELAGKTIEYSFTVEKIFKGPSEKVQALAEEAGFKATFADGVANVTIEGTEKTATDLAVKKLRLLSALFHLIDGVKSVKFAETYAH